MTDEAKRDQSEENCPVHCVPLIWRYDGVVKVYVPQGIYGRRPGVYEVPRTRILRCPAEGCAYSVDPLARH
jgi:hypothetical protein